ncbi:Bax inhibitor-1/YccA family protein [archaeon]|jgi:uncharacterized protein|nr:Bax inhibitor-1/YccA family protein [archaeon]MBT4022638.1 Bax inhibitor-1/YccA family protein [archaeon]MBT4272078.1 Bax inhibitor-1/YccA family protein [archaeon]MBT4461175.1 Bax inhibitor-1/YccA family protein [archaeon]MBT4858698.1 Bax inhibitor-1/YccA family protein [archaeon]
MHHKLQIEQETQRFFTKVFGWMFLGLLLSGFTAYYVSITPAILAIIFSSQIVFFGLLIVELVLVISLSAFIKKVSATLATFLFLLYSFVTGLTLSVIFLVYTIESINLVFFITGGMFGLMSFIGYTTKMDLTKFGPILFMGLLGIIIAGFANLFLRNSMLDFIVTIIGVIIFTALTAYDIQRIKKTNIIGNEGTEEDHKEAIIGALTLYLDFINLFLKLLRLTGKRKN